MPIIPKQLFGNNGNSGFLRNADVQPAGMLRKAIIPFCCNI